jgi:membrane protein DedA with SNARE-associated domain
MYQLLLVILGFLGLIVGAVLGYFARQSIARKRVDKIETTLQRRISQVKKEADDILLRATETRII